MLRTAIVSWLAIICVAPMFAQTPAPTGSLVLYRFRDADMWGRNIVVSSDSSPLGRVLNGRFLVSALTPGKHPITTRDAKQEVTITAGQTVYLRLDVFGGMFGRVRTSLVPVMPGQGYYEANTLNPSDFQDIMGGAGSAPQALTPPPAGDPAPKPKALTNRDIINMSVAGLGEWLIIRKIQDSPNEFKLTPIDLIELKRNNVSELVIGAMLDAPVPKK